jgi:SAM-dependent methyltransferase
LKNVRSDYEGHPLYGFALRTGLWRHFKTARGMWRTWFSKQARAYDSRAFWSDWYSARIDDATTIEAGNDPLATRIHYNCIENAILAWCHRHRVAIEGAAVLDVGSGAGHWLEFYRGMGAARCVGCEYAAPAAEALRARFPETVAGPIGALEFGPEFDIVNAIGVMFHIVDDAEWRASLKRLKAAVKPGGVLIVGGEFGAFSLNVQWDGQGRVSKRIRGYRRWKQELAGWTVERAANRSWRLVAETMPEANLLFARKP